jgi:hypothetical protein
MHPSKLCGMKTKTLCAMIIFLCGVAGAYQSRGATIPAGTVFVVRTLSPVSSVDAVGRRFSAQLEHDITVNGKVVVPAGTQFSGKVVTSRRLVTVAHDLTVDLTAFHAGGHNIPITTTGAQFLSNDIRTKGGVSISRGNYTVASGKRMRFQLARPVGL